MSTSTVSVGLLALLVASLALQALLPKLRVPIVLLAAGVSTLVCASSGLETPRALLGAVPWDVIVLLIALGVISTLLAEARIFERLAVTATRRGGGAPSRVPVIFCVAMYCASALVNNLTALLLVLPVLLILLRLAGTSRRHLVWTIGGLLVACNLGGAATPIGDFPAILLLGAGAMKFVDYLVRALPSTLAALAVFVFYLAVIVRPARDVPSSPAGVRLTVSIVGALYRRVFVKKRIAVPALISFIGMIAAWTLLSDSIAPEVVAWVGVGVALLAVPREAARVLRNSVDVDATLFLFALFVQVGAVQATGLFDLLAQEITALPISPTGRLMVFLLCAGVLTGILSAGPAMAALLVVARDLAVTLPGDVVYVGLALSVCAGSSLFLTAATAGPLAQGLVERAGLTDADRRPLRFGFSEFLPVGVTGFAIIQATALIWAAVGLSRS